MVNLMDGEIGMDIKQMADFAEALLVSTRVKWLLVTAFEGGSNYWYHDLHIAALPAGSTRDDFEHWHGEVPLVAGGALGLKDDDDGSHTLTIEDIEKGLSVMKAHYPRQWDAVCWDDADGDVADVFLQCCIFGEVIYG